MDFKFGTSEYKDQMRQIHTMREAKEIMQNFGKSFVVYVGGIASGAFTHDSGAQREAKAFSAKHGRENVRIKCIKV